MVTDVAAGEVMADIKDLTAEKTDEDQPDVSDRVDIADFVVEVQRLSTLVEPFVFIFYTAEDYRRWRNPNVTIVLWLLLNLLCFILTKGSMFVIVSSLVILIATVSLVHVHTRILNKFLPETRRDISDRENEEVDEATILHTVKEFRYSLIQIHEFLCKCNDYLNHFYGLLKWEDLLPSIKFHVEVCGFMLSFVILPARWIFIVVINWFFLCHEDMLKYIGQFVKDQMEKKSVSADHGEQTGESRDSATYSSLNLNGSDSHDQDPTTEGTGSLSETGPRPDEEKQKPGMVARFMELRKRRQQIASESCYACKVSFSSILKRRYYCRHCGNNFCSKCCSQKVPRSMFGATAPAAQTETVLVCNICHALLNSKEEVTS